MKRAQRKKEECLQVKNIIFRRDKKDKWFLTLGVHQYWLKYGAERRPCRME